MPELADGEVILTVTSPPYWNAIDYDRHADDASQDYRTRAYQTGYTSYTEYLDWLTAIFHEVQRATRPGGFCAVVLGTVLHQGQHYPLPFHFTSAMTVSGWDFHQDILWHKCTAGVKRAGTTIQHPYPGYYYPNLMTEYILVFRKPGPPIYQARPQAQRQEAAFPINQLFTLDTANNVWHIAPVPPRQLEHPCPFPEEIPHRLIQLYSYPGDLVLDPFLGSGQTLKAAHHLGRQGVGYEIIEQYARLAAQRLTEPSAIRPQQLVARFDKIALDAPSGTRASTLRHPRTASGKRRSKHG